MVLYQKYKLLDDLSNNAGTNGTAAFTNSETQTLLDSDGGDELNLHVNVVARLAHLNALGEVDDAGNVGGTEVELRTVVVEERSMTAAFFLGQDVNLASELVRGLMEPGLHRTWPRSISFLSTPRSRAPMLSPASA